MSRKIIGSICVVLGAALVLSALALILYNRREDDSAGKAAASVLPGIKEIIAQKTEPTVPPAEPGQEPTEPLPPEPTFPEEPGEMTVVEIDGWGYIGYLSVPSLGLELPVMAQWSYPQLKLAPCRQFGAVGTNDMVIAAHNFQNHFGRLKELSPGDSLTFVDMDGKTTAYIVEVVETIPPYSTEMVKNSDWDLVLYTCTYGGRTRVMVGCIRGPVQAA